MTPASHHPQTAGPRRKQTDDIKLPRARTLKTAFNFARAIGAPLNRWVTIHWAGAPSHIDPFDRLALFLDRYKAWAYRRAFAPAWTYVRERQLSRVEHAHLAVHVPPDDGEAFDLAARGWVERDAIEPMTPETIMIKPIRIGTDYRVAMYMLKGGNAAVRKTYDLVGRPTQGRIDGKRTGVSHNIGATAQLDAGWHTGATGNLTRH